MIVILSFRDVTEHFQQIDDPTAKENYKNAAQSCRKCKKYYRRSGRSYKGLNSISAAVNENEFDHFGKYLANFLRKLTPLTSIKCQKLQKVITWRMSSLQTISKAVTAYQSSPILNILSPNTGSIIALELDNDIFELQYTMHYQIQ